MHIYSLGMLYMVFGIPLSSLYCNTLLANLNARAYIRGDAVTHSVGINLVTVRLPVSDDTRADEQSGETEFISPAHQVSFHDPNWLNRHEPG